MFGFHRMSLTIVFVTICRLTDTISEKRAIDQVATNLPTNTAGLLQLDNKTIENQPKKEGFILLTKSLRSDHPMERLTKRSVHPVETHPEGSKIDLEIDSFVRVNNEESSRHLFDLAVEVDGSGDTTESSSETPTIVTTVSISTTSTTTPTTSTTTTTTSTTPTTTTTTLSLPKQSTFNITVNCSNALNTIEDILGEFNRSVQNAYEYRVEDNRGAFVNIQCTRALADKVDVILTFFTLDSIAIQNDIVKTLLDILSEQGIPLYSNPCGDGFERVEEFKICGIIDRCRLCGERGACSPIDLVARCDCFDNSTDPSIIYTGDFCEETRIPVDSAPSLWQTILIGVFSGIIGLLLIISFCLLVIFCRSRRRKKNPDQVKIVDNRSTSPVSTPIPLPRLGNSTVGALVPNPVEQRRENKVETSLPANTFAIPSFYDPISELDAIIGDDDDADLTLGRTNPRYESYA